MEQRLPVRWLQEGLLHYQRKLTVTCVLRLVIVCTQTVGSFCVCVCVCVCVRARMCAYVCTCVCVCVCSVCMCGCVWVCEAVDRFGLHSTSK